MIYYCSNMSNDDIKYICNAIPIENIRNYFTKNSKEFAKIKPGFRANKIKDSEARKILFLFRKNNFISSYLNKTIDLWLHQIEKALNEELSKNNKNSAYIKVLSDSYFNNNVKLYFKLNNSNESNEIIELLDESIALICKERKAIETNQTGNNFVDKNEHDKQIREIKNKYEKEVKKLNKHISIMNVDIIKINDELKKTKNNLEINNKQLEVEKLKNREINNELATLQKDNKRYKKEIASIKKERKNYDKFLLFNAKNFAKTIRPQTKDEFEKFKEIFKYNLKNILGENHNKYSGYLCCYIATIVFSGIPIVIKKDCSDAMIKCIASSIFGSQEYSLLTYDCNINTTNIIEYLESSKDIVCFDNFLGNFNETVLLSICSHFKNKITFFTYSYDRTLNYLSEEFYEHICYINLSHIFSYNSNNDFDLETIMISHEETTSGTCDENMYTKETKKILKELGFSDSIISTKCRFVNDICSLSAALIFDILPYYRNVLIKNPFLYSKKLKSLVENIKFPFELKGDIKDWYMNE